MRKRKFDEMIAYVNRKISEMEIGTSYKVELLGMVVALGYEHKKETEERKTGQWLPDNNNYITPHFVCSACGMSQKVETVMYKPIWAFCPRCGARMMKEGD